MKSRLAVVAAVLWSAVACGGAGSDGPGGETDTSLPTDVTVGAMQLPGTLAVGQALAAPSFYREGTHSFIRIEEPGGGEQLQEQDLGSGDLTRQLVQIDLPAGAYVVSSWQQPCDGNCDTLDPVSDECAATVEVEARATALATVWLTPGEGCEVVTLTLEPHRPDAVGVGQVVAHQLYTHCGIRNTGFDGRDWLAAPSLDDGSGNPPAGYGNPYDDGEMTLLSPGIAEFRSSEGQTARFAPMPPTTEPPTCD